MNPLARPILLLTIFVVFASVLTASDTVVEKVILPGPEFSTARLRSMSGKWLLGPGGASGALSIINFFSDPSEAGRYQLGKTSQSYEEWLGFHAAYGEIRGDVAQLLSIRFGSLLRIRLRDGTIQRIVLAGQDPLRVNVAGKTFEILHVVERPPARMAWKYASLRTSIFVQSVGPLREQDCRAATELIAARFERDVAVHVQTDSWFVWNTSFPVVYYFAPFAGPPGKAEVSLPSCHCNVFQGELSCILIPKKR